jgi:hypothetical protein
VAKTSSGLSSLLWHFGLAIGENRSLWVDRSIALPIEEMSGSSSALKRRLPIVRTGRLGFTWIRRLEMTEQSGIISRGRRKPSCRYGHGAENDAKPYGHGALSFKVAYRHPIMSSTSRPNAV